MRTKFATGTRNMQRFLDCVGALERRGAKEACQMLVTGEAGHGKSSAVKWYILQEGGIYLRAKADWTPNWLLTDLVTELGVQPAHRKSELYRQAREHLVKRPRPWAIDEIEHCLRDSRVLETIRDVADDIRTTTILIGMQDVERRLQRYPQVYGRISQICSFGRLDETDLRSLLDDLCEVPVADEALPGILAQTEGYARLVMDAIAEIERIAGRANGAFDVNALVQLNGRSLIGGKSIGRAEGMQ